MLAPGSMKRLMRHKLAQSAFARLVGFYLMVALRTTRWRLEGEENIAPFARGRPVVVAFWHDRIAVTLPLWGMALRIPGAQPAPVRALVSHHRDGQLIGSTLRRFGASPISGSSSRGGTTAVRALVSALARGDHVTIIPDGPRGPRRQAAAGVAQIAALSGAPVLPCAAQTTRRRIMRSWDRMVIPLPFGRGVVVCGPAISVSREGWRPALPQIAAALNAAADRADALCSVTEAPEVQNVSRAQQ